MGNINVTPDIEIGVSTPVTPIDVLPSVDTADNCGCGTGCEIQGLEDAVNKPIGIAPTFIQPSVVLDGSLNPIVAIIGDTLNYELDYTQNDGGIVDDVEVWIDDELVYVGGLTGEIPDLVYAPGTHDVVFIVTTLPGPNGYDTQGNLVPNPIGPQTLPIASTVPSVAPFYSGTVAEIVDIPNGTFDFPQIADLYLNTNTTHRRFWFAIKQGATVVTLEDSMAMYIDLSGLFTFVKSVLVEATTYNVYVMTNAIPYNTNHKFLFNVSY